MNPKALPLLLIAAVVVAGSFVRFTHLDRANFNGDELDHYYAARSIEAGGQPVLPSGSVYSRALDFTRLVGVSLRYVEPPELATRLPSAVFGVLSLVLIAFIAWKLGGPWAAVWATALLAIFPEAIVQSRMTRFYTYQQCCGLIALYAGWRSLQAAGSRDDPTAAEWRRAWLWGLVTAGTFYLSTRVQLTTLSVIVAWCAAVLIAMGADLRRRGATAWRRSFPIQAGAIILVCAVIGLLAFPGTVARAVAQSQYVAAWSGPGKALAYYYSLSGDLPLIVSLLPLIYLLVILKNPRLGVYLGVWFFVPLLLHSWVFPWKGIRYVLLALPAMFVAAGIAAATAYGAVRRWIDIQLREQGWPEARARRFAWLGVALIAAFVVVTTNAFNSARRVPEIPKPIKWRAAAVIVDSLQQVDSVRIGSSMGLPAMYYWGGLDFVVGSDFLERPRLGTGAMEIHSQGTPDWYSGAPTLTVPEAIRRYYPDSRQFVIGIDTDRWNFNNIDPSLRNTLVDQGVELCRGRCGDLLLFLWSTGESAAAPSDEADAPLPAGAASAASGPIRS